MTPTRNTGFTLVEVLVALGIVAVALIAGMQASAALTNNAEHQSARILAQLCAQNALAQIRLARQLPDIGESSANCQQAGRSLELRIQVQPTPNPNFRRVDARVAHAGQHLLQLSTVVGRY